MEDRIMARQIKADTNMRCDLDAPGHVKLIPKGRVGYQVMQGEAQGLFHGKHCHQAALSQVRAKKQELGL